jgi:hypothetical protein
MCNVQYQYLENGELVTGSFNLGPNTADIDISAHFQG